MNGITKRCEMCQEHMATTTIDESPNGQYLPMFVCSRCAESVVYEYVSQADLEIIKYERRFHG